MRGTLRWTRRSLFASAAILGYSTFVAEDAWVFERRESHNLRRLLEDYNVGGRSSVIPFTSSALRLTDLLFAPKEYIHQHNQGREA